MDAAVTELVKMINCTFCTCTSSNEADDEHPGYTTLKFLLVPPQYFPMHLFGELQKTMTSYLVMRTLQQWILQHKPDEAVITTSETEKLTMQLRELMNCRVKPRKATNVTKTNIEL
jgi:hypothetical protein